MLGTHQRRGTSGPDLGATLMPNLTTIDLMNPAQTCQHLGLTEQGLLDLANRGDLAAYNIGGEIRFRTLDVLARKSVLPTAC